VTPEALLPLSLSALGAVAWALAVGGLLDHWRRRWDIPEGAWAAGIVATVSVALAYLASSGIYIDGAWTAVSRPVANIERAVIATTGVYALVDLLRSARRQRQQQRQPRGEHREPDQ